MRRIPGNSSRRFPEMDLLPQLGDFCVVLNQELKLSNHRLQRVFGEWALGLSLKLKFSKVYAIAVQVYSIGKLSNFGH